MFEIKVPATSANLGPGFDCAGLALNLYNTVWAQPWDCVDIKAVGEMAVPTDQTNLVFRAARETARVLGHSLQGLWIRQQNRIPLTGGLGSSACCVVAGVLIANELFSGRLKRSEMLDIACRIEGHPDNAAAAIYGGATFSVKENNRIQTACFPISDDIEFAVLTPPYVINTDRARMLVPKTLSKEDTVYNLSRSALLAAAFASQNYALLGVACGDRLHQPYRLPLIPGSLDVLKWCTECGAYASFLSGSGSSLIAVVPKSEPAFWENISKLLSGKEETSVFVLRRYAADNCGARIRTTETTERVIE